MIQSTSKSEVTEALNAVQGLFAIINISGRFFGLPIDQTTKDLKAGTPLSFYPRSDLMLSIKRYLKLHYPAVKPIKVLKHFFEHPETICYVGIEFNPQCTTENFLNLWQGLVITPQEGDWSGIREFLYHIICHGDDVNFNYLINYLAHAIQCPFIRLSFPGLRHSQCKITPVITIGMLHMSGISSNDEPVAAVNLSHRLIFLIDGQYRFCRQ